MTQRASIFDNDLKVDVSDFSPKKRPDIKAPTQEQVRAVAEAANFPKPPGAGHIFETTTKRAAASTGTGRNVQFNVKASQETVEAFYAVTEAHAGWVLAIRWSERSQRSSASWKAKHDSRPVLQSQFDLFLPTIVDLRFRDQKDTMERPFFSLSKSKRMKPIQYVNENDGYSSPCSRIRTMAWRPFGTPIS